MHSFANNTPQERITQRQDLPGAVPNQSALLSPSKNQCQLAHCFLCNDWSCYAPLLYKRILCPQSLIELSIISAILHLVSEQHQQRPTPCILVTAKLHGETIPVQVQNISAPLMSQMVSLNQVFSLDLGVSAMLLLGHKLEGYVNGTRPCPAEFVGVAGTGENTLGFGLQLNPEYEHWIVCDQLLTGWLYGSMTEGIATEVMGCTSARSLWVALENLYGAHSRAKMDDTQTKIQTTRKGSTTMANYLRQKRTWADSLELSGDPYLEAHLIANVLSDLDGKYLTIVCLLEAQEKIGLT
ncbi:hypothetical protein F8388_018380 [Cannabis sativa]|uniref:Uncharacterized protein n=1 Tax=Cannabis sativa TaxID=3483 RepID=A0A7J6HH96_CANSA|nr:hypothetical protein F8388_018380 [Cannabis sativa]